MHRKISPVFHNDVKMLRLPDLPESQYALFLSWLHPDQLYSIDGNNAPDCAKYEHYDYWYSLHYCTEKDFDDMI